MDIMTTKSAVYLAANVRAIREKLGLTQKDFAAKIGWEQSRLCEIETASSDRRLSYLDDLAVALGVPTHELITPPTKPIPIKLQTKFAEILSSA